ncbi:MAG: Fic family protein [Tenericutes bacterium]|nr:Fic family protein [Mycoplasmatota bacterium]
MEPYKATKLPFTYEMSNELLKFLCDAKETYGEYKGYLKNMSYDYKHFLESLFINDIYYSFKIDNTKLTKDDMFFMPYKVKNNNVIEFNNIKKALVLGLSQTNINGFSVDIYNKLHKVFFTGCKKDNLTKGSGHLRKKQTFILKPGLAGSSVSFVPPVYTEVNSLIKNLCEYINDSEDEPFVAAALTHYQFEKIHPYVSGNGKLGRLMIPIQLSFYKKEPPILFLSESIEELKNTYFTLLSTTNELDYNKFIKFILQCIINQCNLNIKKIKKLNKIYESDLELFKKEIGGTTIYKVYPAIIKNIVFTTNDIVTECKLHINSVNKVLNKLVDSGFLIKEKKKGTNRVTFCYKSMYDIFMN